MKVIHKNVSIQISWNYTGREESQKYLYECNIFGILLLKFLVHDRAHAQKPKIQQCYRSAQ